MPYFELSLVAAIFVLGASHLLLQRRVNIAEKNVLRLLLATSYLLEITDDEDDRDTD